MVTLLKRATSQQIRLFRIIAGAVRNVADHHPELNITRYTVRSIAKRAVGTLTAQMPDVLAGLPAYPSRKEALTIVIKASPASHSLKARDRFDTDTSKRRGMRQTSSHPPLRKIIRELSFKAGQARRNNNTEALAAYVTTLRLLVPKKEKVQCQPNMSSETKTVDG